MQASLSPTIQRSFYCNFYWSSLLAIVNNSKKYMFFLPLKNIFTGMCEHATAIISNYLYSINFFHNAISKPKSKISWFFKTVFFVRRNSSSSCIFFGVISQTLWVVMLGSSFFHWGKSKCWTFESTNLQSFIMLLLYSNYCRWWYVKESTSFIDKPVLRLHSLDNTMF